MAEKGNTLATTRSTFGLTPHNYNAWILSLEPSGCTAKDVLEDDVEEDDFDRLTENNEATRNLV